jgi:signal transduction histidine kinase
VETLAQRILDSMDQAVVASDADGQVTVYNRAAEDLFGGALSSSPDKPIESILGGGSFSLREIAGGADAIHGREFPLKRGDGVRQIVFSTTPVITADGRREGAVSVLRDETEARGMAERVQRSSRLTEMGTLAAGVAHEIRNPLNAIAIAAQRLRMEMTDPDAEKIAGTVLDESRRLNAIVEDFLSLARPSAQPSVELDFSQLVESVASMAALDAGQRGIGWDAGIARDISVEGVSDELRKALWNVLTNAIAATPSGGHVSIRLECVENTARLTIDDSGSGIDPENLSRIFQPYFTTKDHGTGLGLAITHRIVTDHRGSITVHSPPPGADIGTRMTIELPGAGNSD